MGCCHHFAVIDGGANTFTIAMPKFTFGRGALKELGERARLAGLRHAALFTDTYVGKSSMMEVAKQSLREAGVLFTVFDEVRIEPDEVSVLKAAAFLKDAAVDGVISIGGGSVMDTAKAALVYATYPADFRAYFAPPVGDGIAVPGPMMVHIACPTTSGTGSEVTALSVIRLSEENTKFVIASPYILPLEAIIDPDWATSLPATVVASTGFDLLSHALECYTARGYTSWPLVSDPGKRPAIQGANPWSDLHAREALRIVGTYLPRGVADAADLEARGQLMWAATLAGMAFANSGTHLPHALSYGVTNLVRDYRQPGYPAGGGAFVHHGISVVLNAPSVFRFTAQAAPTRHLQAAKCLGARTDGALSEDAGELLAGRIIELMKASAVPNGLAGIGFGAEDAESLTDSAIRQVRAIANAPRDTSRDDIAELYAGALCYW